MNGADRVEPALTPTQWREVAFDPEWWAREIKGLACAAGELVAMRMQTPMPHAGAALLLHGQPFGFTREDVAFLRNFAEVTRGASDLEHLPTHDRYASLADRIAALLPPEPQPEDEGGATVMRGR